MTPHGPRAKTQNLRGSHRAPHWRVTLICSSCSAIAPALAPGTPVSRPMRQGVMVAAFGACAGAKRMRVKPNGGHRVRTRRERTAARIHVLSPQHSRPRRDRGCWPSSSHSARPPDAVMLRTPAGGGREGPVGDRGQFPDFATNRPALSSWCVRTRPKLSGLEMSPWRRAVVADVRRTVGVQGG